MVKKVLLVGVLLLCAHPVNAQAIKVLGGVGFGSYATSWDMSNERLPGVVFGAGIEVGVSGLMAEADVIYIEKKNRYVSRSWDSTLSEVSVPLLLKFKAGQGTGPYLVGGGEVARILSQTQTERGGTGRWELETRRLDAGLVVGGGFEAQMGPAALEIEGRYHLGLVDTTRFSSDGYDFKTRVFVLLAGVKF
jgi:hypothetical protein